MVNVMKRIPLCVLCVTVALASLSVTACHSTEPSYTVITTANTEAGGLGNPWKEALTLEEAAYGANLNEFVFNEAIKIDGASINPLSYKYTDCIAEAKYSLGDLRFAVRKSKLEYMPSGDISGIYEDYAHEWKADINGNAVKSYGNEQGKARKVIWVNKDLCYSICIDHKVIREEGLSEAAVRDLVNAVR